MITYFTTYFFIDGIIFLKNANKLLTPTFSESETIFLVSKLIISNKLDKQNSHRENLFQQS